MVCRQMDASLPGRMEGDVVHLRQGGLYDPRLTCQYRPDKFHLHVVVPLLLLTSPVMSDRIKNRHGHWFV
jgi:hypothetical protein